jgi:hypothetical protein
MTVTEIGQLLAGILSDFMGIPLERIVLSDETFDAPKDRNLYILIIHDPLGNETVAINSSINSSSGVEKMSRVSHERFAIELISASREAIDRYQEIHMAIASVKATQKAELAGCRFFRAGDPMNLTAIEGSRALKRYRVPVIVTNIQAKSAAVPMIDKFPALSFEANTLKVED